MAWHPITIDDSITRIGGGSVHVREGQYLFALANIVPSKEDYEGEPHFRFELLFTDGPDPLAKGQKITYIATFKEDAQFGLGGILTAIGGVKVDSLKGKAYADYSAWAKLAETLADRLKTKPLGGTVIDNNYNGRISSRVDKVWPASEWENRRGAVVASQTPTPSAPATNGAMVGAAPVDDSTFLADVDAIFN